MYATIYLEHFVSDFTASLTAAPTAANLVKCFLKLPGQALSAMCGVV